MDANAKMNYIGGGDKAPTREGSLDARLGTLRMAVDDLFDEHERMVAALGNLTLPMPTNIAAQTGGSPQPPIAGSAYGSAIQTQINRIGDLNDRMRMLRNALDLT